MNNKKGISLVILVITVLVLIILSATVITLVTDEDFSTEAKNAVKDATAEQVITAIKLEIRQYRLDKELENIYEITEQEIINIIQKYGTIQTIEGEQCLVNEQEEYQIKLGDIDPIFNNN